MPDREWLQMLTQTPIGAEFRTPSNLEDLADNVRERLSPEDALPVCAALARHLAEALRAINDLREENTALRKR
jgi:hypothetical protein